MTAAVIWAALQAMKQSDSSGGYSGGSSGPDQEPERDPKTDQKRALLMVALTVILLIVMLGMGAFVVSKFVYFIPFDPTKYATLEAGRKAYASSDSKVVAKLPDNVCLKSDGSPLLLMTNYTLGYGRDAITLTYVSTAGELVLLQYSPYDQTNIQHSWKWAGYPCPTSK